MTSTPFGERAARPLQPIKGRRPCSWIESLQSVGRFLGCWPSSPPSRRGSSRRPRAAVDGAAGARDPVRTGPRDQPGHPGLVHAPAREAAKSGYDAAVIELDTPGGLSELDEDDLPGASSRSKVPVIVYVAPSGARAASAGVWLSQAADVLAMSPISNIGSSTPIDSSGAEHQLRPAAQGDQRRGRVADARSPRRHQPQHDVAGARRAQGVEPDGAAGAEDERDRLDRADACPRCCGSSTATRRRTRSARSRCISPDAQIDDVRPASSRGC